MVKEISSFREKKVKLDNAFNLIDKLNIIVDHFQENYQVEMYFCEIIGNRWSFVAGNEKAYLPSKRIQLFKNLGVVLDDSQMSDELTTALTEIVKSSLKDTVDGYSG